MANINEYGLLIARANCMVMSAGRVVEGTTGLDLVVTRVNELRQLLAEATLLAQAEIQKPNPDIAGLTEAMASMDKAITVISYSHDFIRDQYAIWG
jgi:hypothetical protein